MDFLTIQQIVKKCSHSKERKLHLEKDSFFVESASNTVPLEFLLNQFRTIYARN